jgi:hypothetical protein
MRPTKSRSIKAEIKARRALVLKNMYDLMKGMGQDEKFNNPDDWMDSIVERPRRRAHSLRRLELDPMGAE